MQDFLKQQADWVKTWQESQEKLTKQYAELGQEFVENISGKNKEPDFFEGWFKSQSDMEKQFREFSKRLNEMISKVWSDKVPADVLKFMNISFFEEFYKNWLSNLELPGGIKNPLGMDGGWQQATSFLRSFMEKDHPFFSSFGSSNISDQMSRIFGMMQGAMGKEESAFGDIFSNYQNMFGKLFESTTAQGAEKLAEGFETWAKEIEKHLSAPKVGINRELAHDMSQSLVMSQKYIQAYTRMARLVEATSRKAGIRFQTKLSEAAIKKKPVTKFTELCALWSVENEAVFLEVMGSQEFAKLQGDFVDAGHQLKIQWNKLAEKALEPTPIALKRDLDLAIKEIHQMKRDMRSFQREFKELQKEARAARESQAAVEKELQNAKAAEVAALNEAKNAKAAEAAAREDAKKAKAAEAASLENVNKAKLAEAALQEDVKQLKLTEVDVKEVAKQAKTADKTVKASPRATTKTKSKNV